MAHLIPQSHAFKACVMFADGVADAVLARAGSVRYSDTAMYSREEVADMIYNISETISVSVNPMRSRE